MSKIAINPELPNVFVDGVSKGAIKGWAQNAESVAVYIENNLIAEVSCNEYREDLDGVLANPHASFSYALDTVKGLKNYLELPVLNVKCEFKVGGVVNATNEVSINTMELKAQLHEKANSTELDTAFYKSHYTDLSKLSANQLVLHWEQNGKAEGRFPNANMFIRHSPAMQFDLDFDFYTQLYPDLVSANVTDLNSAKLHWLYFGKQENRYISFADWLNKNSDDELVFDPSNYNYKNILKNNDELSVSLFEYLNTLKGVISKPIRLLGSDTENATLYEQVGAKLYDKFKQSNDPVKRDHARNAWRVACFFKASGSTLVHIAKSYFEEGDYKTAQKVCEQAIKIASKLSPELIHFMPECFAQLNNTHEGLSFLKQYRAQYPSQSYVIEKLDALCQKLYLDNLGEIQVLANLNKRDALLKCSEQYSSTIYQAYYDYYSQGAQLNSVPLRAKLNAERVLIIGDYHIPQCIRYRIEQKVEQLESQGKVVTTIDWLELDEHHNEIALHDVVIFYRVPAVPSILKAAAQINANGKASFFEIDDLLFEPSYPAPIETFGGYVDLNTHINLRKSPANFAAMAKCCRFGIASTELLRKKLAKLVFSDTCLLHRNGLDKHNYFAQIDKTHKKTIDIFYGSGTQAHNSDFTELALPALEAVLSQHSNARLIIAGYLELPSRFKARFNSQLVMVPPVKSVKAYWQLLEQADINLAILNDNEVNGCKSELKWFEAACVGVPSVLSSTANYRDVINNSQDALMVTAPSEWEEALTSLITNQQLREKIANNALKRVKAEYTVKALGEKFVSDIANTVNVNTKSKKKIALVNVFFPPQSIGGATRVLSDNFDILQKQYGDDFELVVFTSDDRCTTPYKLETYQHQGVIVYRSTILFRENMDWHPKDENMYDLFEEFLQLEQPDLVHFHCVQRLTASVVEATKDNNIPYIVTAHDAWWISDHQFLIDQKDNVYPNGHPDMFAPRVLPNNVSLSDSIERINYYKELLNGAAKLLTVSECFADIYAQNGYPDIVVNKNGISSTVQWQPKNTDYTENVVCAHIGGMANHKGYFLLKEAIEQQQPKNLEMLIVDHSKEQGYEHKSKWGNVPVTYIGRVNQQGVVNLYQKIDVLFAPSLWPESYGLVTREAAASSCWVVASNMGGIGEDVEATNGHKITPNLDALISIITIIDSTPSKYKILSSCTLHRSVQEQVKELSGYYR
ncbi:glycosyltransferase [Pseudoalteromonas carrageenovora]|uniref:glycosyltransferase n=1 Tax=Pseudoalteromonas carrageenovora TaxID=227 RepID=UPI00311DDE21